jgi:hypothetical protein
LSFKFSLLKIRVSLQPSVVEFAENRVMVVGERRWAKSTLSPGHAIAPLLAEKSIPQRCAIACRCDGKDFFNARAPCLLSVDIDLTIEFKQF